MQSPSSTTLPALPSFPFTGDSLPHSNHDTDFLPSWSQDPSPSLSYNATNPSDALFPTVSTAGASDTSAPLSFANVATLAALSPLDTTTSQLDSPAVPTPAATGTPHSPNVWSQPKPEAPADFAEFLTEGLQRRDTDGQGKASEDEGRIQAYAKLEFDHFDIYIQKLSVVLGRRPASASSRKASLTTGDEFRYDSFFETGPIIKQEETLPNFSLSESPAPLSSAAAGADSKPIEDPFSEFVKSSPPLPPSIPAPAEPTIPTISVSTAEGLNSLAGSPFIPSQPVASTSAAPIPPPLPTQSATDIDLGPVRAVSRQHAKLFFDHELGGWILEVIGRNGVVIEGHWRGKGQKTLLLERTKIQIADRIFHFVLPTIDVVPDVQSVADVANAGKGKSKGKAMATTKANGKGKGKGKATTSGKGKGKAKAKANDESSSSLSEVSDSDVELSPLQTPSLDLAPSPAVSSSAKLPNISAPSTTLSPAPLPLSPAKAGASPMLPPLPPRSSSLPNGTTATPGPSTRSSRSPLPRAASLRSMAPPPRAASRNAVYTDSPVPVVQSPVPRTATQAPPTAEELEMGRQRAAQIADLLAGRGLGGKAPAAISQATKRATNAAKAKAGTGRHPPPPGKAPGKGKGPLPPRPTRSSTNAWDEVDEDASSSSSSSDESDEDETMVDGTIDESLLPRKTPSKGRASRPPSPPTTITTLAPPPLETSDLPQKGAVAKKQPKRRDPTVAPSPSTSASPLPSSLPTMTPTSLPPLPSSTASLPPLPVSTTNPSPIITPSAVSSTSLPPASISVAPSPASTSSTTLPSASPAPTKASGETFDESSKSTNPSASTTALPLAPPSALAIAAGLPPPVPATAGAATTKKKSKAKATVSPSAATAGAPPPLPPPPKKKSHKAKPPAENASAVPAKVDTPPTIGADGNPLPPKPRPTPYTPAPHPPGEPLPTEAPADNRNVKPPYTYASLIAQAISQSDLKKLTMQQVYEWIISKWPYFNDNQSGWQNSIRHNLTPARGFVKVLRLPEEPGKGAFWKIDPEQISNFDGFHFRRNPTSNPKGTTSSSKAAATAAKTSSNPPPASTSTPSTTASPAKTNAAASTSTAAATSSTSSTKVDPATTKSAASTTPAAKTGGNSTLAKPLPIIVAPIPDSYVRPATPQPVTGNAANDEMTQSLLADPPIVLHEGKLILNPNIFAHLTKEQLDNLQALPASKALQILQAFVVQHFKDKMRKAAAEKQRAAKAAAAEAAAKAESGGGGGGVVSAGGSSTSAPSTSTKGTSSSVATSAAATVSKPSTSSTLPTTTATLPSTTTSVSTTALPRALPPTTKPTVATTKPASGKKSSSKSKKRAADIDLTKSTTKKSK